MQIIIYRLSVHYLYCQVTIGRRDFGDMDNSSDEEMHNCIVGRAETDISSLFCFLTVERLLVLVGILATCRPVSSQGSNGTIYKC